MDTLLYIIMLHKVYFFIEVNKCVIRFIEIKVTILLYNFILSGLLVFLGWGGGFFWLTFGEFTTCL